MTVTLAGKIAKASADLGNRLKADKKNVQGGGYMYISADKLIAEAGAVLAANGVAVFPSIVGYNVDSGESSGGKRNYIVTVNFMMAVSDGDSNMDCPWIGAGVDYGAMDKALYKGITSGHKYFLAKLLNIGEGNEDSEHESPTPAPQNERKEPAAQHRTPPAAASAPTTSAPTAGKASNGNGGAGNGQAKQDNPRDVAFKAFMATGSDLFGGQWNDARQWLVTGYTTKYTPDKVRTSSKQLGETELRDIEAELRKNGAKYTTAWEKYCTKLEAANVHDAPEQVPE